MDSHVDCDAAIGQRAQECALHRIRIGQEHDHTANAVRGKPACLDGAGGECMRQVQPMFGEHLTGLPGDRDERRPCLGGEEFTERAGHAALVHGCGRTPGPREFDQQRRQAGGQLELVGRIGCRAAQDGELRGIRTIDGHDGVQTGEGDHVIAGGGAIGHHEVRQRAARREDRGQQHGAAGSLLEVAGQCSLCAGSRHDDHGVGEIDPRPSRRSAQQMAGKRAHEGGIGRQGRDLEWHGGPGILPNECEPDP